MMGELIQVTHKPATDATERALLGFIITLGLRRLSLGLSLRAHSSDNEGTNASFYCYKVELILYRYSVGNGLRSGKPF